MNTNLSKGISIYAAIITMLLGILVCSGWLMYNYLPKTIFSGTVTIKFNLSLSFILLSAALLLRFFPGKNKTRHYISIFLSVISSLIGLLTFAEYFFGFNMGIDELFVRDDLHKMAIYYPGRMSPVSAVNLFLISIGLFLLNNKGTATYQFFYLSGIAFTSLLMLIGFNFIADIPTFINLSIYEAFGFIILCVSIYFAQPMLQKKITFEQKLFTYFSAVIILIAVLSIFSSYYSAKRVSTSQSIKHTNDVLHESEQILSVMKDIEAAGTSYIITLDSNDLHNFTVAKNYIFAVRNKLKKLTEDNPSQQAKIDSLSAIIDNQVSFSVKYIKARIKEDFGVPAVQVFIRQSKVYSDTMRKISSEIQRGENILLSQRTLENQKSIVSFNRAFFVLLGGIAILVAIITFSIHRDITSRKTATRKIKESERMFSTLFFKSPVLKAIIENSTGKYIEVNEAFVNFHGYKKDEILGKTFIDVNIADPQTVSEVVKNIEKKGFARELEMQLNSSSGESIWVSANIDMVNLNGRDCFLLSAIDITKRKIAEENLLTLSQELEAIVIERTRELDKSEKSYRYLFENNPMPMWIIELNTFKFLDINEVATLQYGYSREEFLSMTALDIRPCEEKELFERSDHSFEIDSQNYNKGIWNHRKKDGTIIQVEIVGHAIIFEGLPARLILSNDVTEKRKAEEKLITSEKQFRHTLDNMLEGAQIIGFDWRYIYVNESMTRHAKYSKKELLGYTVMEKFPGIEQSGIYKYYQQCFNERVAIHVENEFIFPDNTIGWFELSFQPVSEGIFILSIDITDRKKAQFEIQNLNEELEQKILDRTEQLERANKELEAFSYSVSHDLRAPLRAINGFAKKLGESYGAVFDIEGQRVFNRIKVNAIKMGLLIDDLLEFSRLGRKEVHKSPIQMTHLVESILVDMNLTISHEATIKIHQLHSANADLPMIKQVMINLLSNAIKYSSKIENPFVEIESHIEGNEIIYSIRDNGAGFNNQYVEKLFGVFQRLHLQSEFEGTGVGLALVKRIINKHGGRVWAIGELNKGATFCFTLPTSTHN